MISASNLSKGRDIGALITRRVAATSLLAAAAGCSLPGMAAAETRLRAGARWAVFYGEDADPALLSPFELIVIDPNFVRPIDLLKKDGAMVLGYLSIGEFNRTKPEFATLRDAGALLYQNPAWPDSFTVDVRNKLWREMLLENFIPRLIARGFDGLFLDTLDSPPHLETLDPQRNHGMAAAAVSLVKAIRKRNPEMPLMINRGYALLPKLVDTIDGVVAESMITSFDPVTKAYHIVDDATVARHLDLLRPAREGRRSLPVYSLDYWLPEEPDAVRSIYARERALGHAPYVGTILLDRLMPEPAA